jgi:hypothetical protein
MRLKDQGGLREKQEICHWQIISTILKTGQTTDLRDAFQWRVMVEWELERGGGAGLFSELLAGWFPHILVPHTHMANPGHRSRSLSVRGPIPTTSIHPSIHPSTHPQSPASPTRTIRSHSLTRCTPLNFHWIRGWRPLRPNCSRMRLTALREDIHSDCRKAAGNPDLAPLARLFCHQHEVYKKRPDINRISYPFPLVVSSSVHPLSCRRQQRSRRSS